MTINGNSCLCKNHCLAMFFPDVVVTRCTEKVDSFLTLLTVFLKRLTTAWYFVYPLIGLAARIISITCIIM